MSLEGGLSVQAEYESKIRRNYRWNFTFNLLDGASFWFGYSFLAPAVILPLYVSHYTDSKLLIGLIAMINTSFFFVPQLFTANWIEHVPVKIKIMARQGLVLERLPLFILPLAAWWVGNSPALALVTFFLLFSWHSMGAGITAVAWQDLIAKVIPVEQRGLFFGLTNFLGSATGVVGASVAAWLLMRYEFPNGFIICFAVTGIFVLVSYLFIIQTREPPLQTSQEPVSFRQYWAKLPAILKNDRNFSNFLLTQIVLNLGGMSWGFLAVYAQQNWNLSDGKVGEFSMALLIGQSLANLAFGLLADRKGYKLVMEISALLAALSILVAILAPGPDAFYLVFGLRGASLAGFFLSMMFVMEFSIPAVRPTYIGLSNTISGAVAGISPLLGGMLANWAGYPPLFVITLLLALASFVLLRWLVRDPRNSGSVAAGETSNG